MCRRRADATFANRRAGGHLSDRGPKQSESRGDRDPLSRWIAILALVLELPQALSALLGFQQLSWRWLERVPSRSLAVAGVLILVGLLLRRLVRSGLVWAPLYPLAQFRLRPVGLLEDPGTHAQLLNIQRRILLMSPKELGQKAGIYRWESEYLCRNPSFLPRPDVQARIRTALMVPSNWPRRGYGSDYTKQRLAWYAAKGQLAWTALRIESATASERTHVLRLIENDLRRGLFGTGHTS